ncbi:ABC transporter substrate-binding protein [Cyanobacterium aponinum UTEX 3222]|uniref:Periplasmic binding protein n=1 Tax=Cyanobacterium aponinum (strain PCC 10605) TaxID=755178 RepID=K9Z4K1_CYAAP|nr:ABC transporter substrate-binding protein [Cyanobacterium aponinum]AFZ54111.1 periplasmic binding protein [Cyanobacterium aponinum PCC 10605]WRL42153.1 ABC transporter substrate-binding protein [Cyanobacterium aponinum UTEX 3222]
MIKLFSFLLFFSLIIPLNSCQKQSLTVENNIINNDYLISVTDASNHELKFSKIPEKIVCLHLSCIDILAELNHPPIAVHNMLLNLAKSDIYFGEKGKNIIPISGYGEPNLEQLLKLKPDLIVGHLAGYSSQRNTLDAIAPVFLIEIETYEDAIDNLEKFANLLNKDEEFKVAKNKFTAKLDNYKKQANNEKIVLVTNGYKGNFFIATKESLLGSVLDELTNYPWSISGNNPSAINWVSLSSEEILTINPDIIFVLVKSPSSNLLGDLRKDSFWQELKAVKNNQVYPLEEEKVGGLTTGTKSLSAFLDQIMPLIY